jgi:DNA polymerase-3 subunit alpha
MNNFIHLHVHSEYSLLDGLSKTKEIVKCVKELGMSAVALTDHGTMYGAVEFYKRAVAEGIKPIIGLEGYVTNRDHRLRESRQSHENHHLILLAVNMEGYRNLMQLTSIAHLEGYYYKPRFDKETLAKYSKGLIATSACPMGEIGSLLVSGEFDVAKEAATWYANTFGVGNFYLEIQRHRNEEFLSKTSDNAIRNILQKFIENEKKYVEGSVQLSRELGLPLLATNDAHYVAPGDASAQDALVCIATGKNVSDINRLRYVDTPTFYLTSAEEMADLFPEYPDALKNTVKIAERCELSLTLDKWYFPEYPLEKGKTYAEVLTQKAKVGLKNIFPNPSSDVISRLDYELKTINEKGYAPYFLIVSDFAEHCRANRIITNTRGSAAGSLVSYVLGITTIDPLKYDLPFERFLTPWRPSPPDIDFDIADDRRDEVIEYIVEKFGKEKVAQICTFGRMLARAAVRDVSRVLGYPYSTGDRIAKLIPIGSQGFPMTLERALESTPDLKGLYNKDADARRIIDLAKQIEGNARHISVHAAGVVIAPTILTDFTPLQLDPEGAKIITQYDMDALDPNVSPKEAVGLLKFDLLGIRNLSILGRAVEIVDKTAGVTIDLRKILLDDKKTFEMLSRGETMGTFQLGGSGMTRYLKELRPTRVEDIMAMVALFRPGPMAVIPEFIARKHNPSQIKYLDPRMKEYLGKSYGLIVYQDDVLSTVIKIAGYTWEEADKFRKAVGKKIPAEMAKQKEKFIEGSIKNGLTKEKAEEIFALIEPFAGYGFNKSHAASYGIVAYQTAYMKANYPVEYITALMTAESGDADKISEAIAECRRMGIIVLSPDINTSEVGFTIEAVEGSLSGKAIRFGLSAIKNVGEIAISSILTARVSGGVFKTLTDFCRRVDGQKVNRKVLESLIKAGALDRFGHRAAMLAGLDKIRQRAGKNDKNENQVNLFFEAQSQNTQEKDDFPTVSEFAKQELLSLEKELLGFYLTEHPLTSVLNLISSVTSHKISQITVEETLGQSVKIGGVITDIRVVVTKAKAQEMAFVKIEDDTGAIEAVVFPKTYAAARELWARDKLVILEGKVDNRDESISIVVDRAFPLTSDIEIPSDINDTPTVNPNDPVTIVIPKGTSPAALIKLNSLLQSSHGSRKMALVFQNGNNAPKRMLLPFGIAWSQDLHEKIKEILNPVL